MEISYIDLMYILLISRGLKNLQLGLVNRTLKLKVKVLDLKSHLCDLRHIFWVPIFLFEESKGSYYRISKMLFNCKILWLPTFNVILKMLQIQIVSPLEPEGMKIWNDEEFCTITDI